MKKMLWLGSWLGVGLGLAGCGQQPYRVFAVQVAAAAPAGIARAGAALPAAPARLQPVAARDLGGLAAKHPQWDLNRASAQTLAGLPGIDAATVAAIIASRPYKSKRELLRLKLVTAAQYARWKDYLVVHRPAPAPTPSPGVHP